MTCCDLSCNSCSSDLGADPSIGGAGILKIDNEKEIKTLHHSMVYAMTWEIYENGFYQQHSKHYRQDTETTRPCCECCVMVRRINYYRASETFSYIIKTHHRFTFFAGCEIKLHCRPFIMKLPFKIEAKILHYTREFK